MDHVPRGKIMKIQIMQQLLPLATGMMTLRYRLQISELTVELPTFSHTPHQKATQYSDLEMNRNYRLNLFGGFTSLVRVRLIASNAARC